MFRSEGLGVLLLMAVVTHGGIVENENYFQKIINEVNSMNTTWVAGNHFDLSTPLSYYRHLMGAIVDNSALQTLPVKKYDNYDQLPQQFDSREQWPHCSTGHIPDQGNCGSCWAIAAASSFTDRVCIASNGKINKPLSAEQIISCCTECGDGCGGGEPLYAWNYIKNPGIVSGGDYQSHTGCQPYGIQPCNHTTINGIDRKKCDNQTPATTPKCYNSCTNKKYHKKFKNDHHKASEVYTIATARDAQKDIYTYGPIEAIYMVYSDFMTYKSGIYHHVSGGEQLGYHGVRIIGWGVEHGTDYWLVANSWNTDWGMNGFFKIKRGVNECGIEQFLIAGTA